MWHKYLVTSITFFTDGTEKKLKNPQSSSKLEKYQKKVLGRLIPCTKNTPPEIHRMLTGTMLITGGLDMLKLDIVKHGFEDCKLIAHHRKLSPVNEVVQRPTKSESTGQYLSIGGSS